MFVTYSNTNGSEVIITTTKKEKAMVKEWFAKDSGRDRDDYERYECSDTAVAVTPNLSVE